MCTFGLSGCRVKPRRAGGGKKKARNFGPPTLLGPTLLGSTLRAPNPSGPQPFGAPLFQGLGLHPWGPPFEPTFCRPKFNVQKLAEVEIGRSRNWPKSKLAELEKKSWPKSKLAEVDHPQMFDTSARSVFEQNKISGVETIWLGKSFMEILVFDW